MNPLVIVLAGAASGSGLLLIALGLRGIPQPPSGSDRALTLGQRLRNNRVRLALAACGGIGMWILSGWPVGAVLAAAAGLAVPDLIGAKRRRAEVIARTEAIASWAEQLRDTIGAAAGLQEAIAVTSRVAPEEIRPAVRELATGMRRDSLSVALRRFAATVADPAADQIVVALILASERRGQNLTRLLGDVAAAARDDASMRIRTETSRAETYSDAKVVSWVVVAMFAFMLLFSRDYLDAFDTWLGQAVLGVVGILWALALHGIAQLSLVRRPPRLLAPSSPSQAADPGWSVSGALADLERGQP